MKNATPTVPHPFAGVRHVGSFSVYSL